MLTNNKELLKIWKESVNLSSIKEDLIELILKLGYNGE